MRLFKWSASASSAPRHRLNTEAGRHRKPRNPAPAFFAIISLITVFFSSNQPVFATNAVNNGCTASISDLASQPATSNASPIVKDSTGALIGAQETFNDYDDGVNTPIDLPFNLKSSTGVSTIQVSTNGIVEVTTTQEAFNLFNSDLDATTRGSIYVGACDLDINGTSYPAFSVTWDDVEFYNDSNSHVTMQIIFVKTGDVDFQVIRNYEQLTAGFPQNITYGYMQPFSSAGDWYGTTVNKMGDTDVMISSDWHDGPNLLSSGAVDLTQHRTNDTNQSGRYYYIHVGTLSYCNANGSKSLTVSYSAPGVQSVNFPGVLVEDFNEFALPGGWDNLPSSFTSQTNGLTLSKTFTNSNNIVWQASALGGADGTGNGVSATDLTITGPANSCFKYMGFWWSAGSANNNVELIDANGNVLDSFSSADLFNAVGSCPDSSNGYCGNPNGLTNPALSYPNEPFAFVNIRYPAGFNSVRLYGSGFEFDNISIASVLPGASSGENLLSGSPIPTDTPSTTTSATPTVTPTVISSVAPGPVKPVIQGLDLTESSTNVYVQPSPPQKQFLNSPTSGDEGWFICTSPHSSPADYDLSGFPGDCSFTDDRNTTFTPGVPETGKYVGYGAVQSNSAGTTFALQTASHAIGDVAIVGLANNGTLTVTNYAILGSISSSTSKWYRCDNPATIPTALPTGCVATTVSAHNYVAGTADLGKFMVYQVTATSATTNNVVIAVADGGPAVSIVQLVSGYISNFVVSVLLDMSGAHVTSLTQNDGAIAAGGQWWICSTSAEYFEAGVWDQVSTPVIDDVYGQMQANNGCQMIPGQNDPSFVPMQLQYDGQFLTYASAATLGDVFILRTRSAQVNLPTSTPTVTTSVSPTTTVSPNVSASSLSTPVSTYAPTVTPTVAPTVTATLTPSASPTATATASVVAPVPTTSATVTNPRNSSTGGRVIPVTPSATATLQETASPEPTSVLALDLPSTKVGGMDPIAAVKSVLAPKADPAIGALGNDHLVPREFSPLASAESAKRFTSIAAWFLILIASTLISAIGRDRRSLRMGALIEADASIEYRRQRRLGWGDRLPLFKLKAITWLDKFSADAIRVTYPKSPVLAKIFNEGAYLRAFFGSLTVFGSIATGALGVYAALSRNPEFVMPSTWLLLAIVAIGVFDAFSGLVGTFALVAATLLTMHSATIQDYRTLLGIFVLGFTPALSAEAFRSVRRRAEKSGSYVWERISDFAIAPLIGGITTVAMVSVLPALANLTLPIANHVIEFGIVAAVGLFMRVALEEFAARAYPTRMDALNPEGLVEPTRMRKLLAIAFKAALYIFVSTAIFGISWQVWVACLIFVIPALMHLYEDRLPNSRTLWRFLPKGIPGMALSLVVAFFAMTMVTWLVRNPATMARYGFMLVAIPALVLTILHVLGRHGAKGELKPVLHPDRKWLYRIGGIVMYGATVWLVANA